MHGVTGAIDEVSNDMGLMLSRCRRKKQSIEESEFDSTDFELLRSRGYLTALSHDAEVDAFVEYVNRLHKKNRASVSSGFVMLAVSYECNLRCPYCYQNELRDRNGPSLRSMSPDFVDTLFTRTLPALYGSTANRLQISLYGGEPFTPENVPAIEQALYYAHLRGHDVSAISNGTRVNEFPNLFGEEHGKVNSVQISLDGIPEIHNKSRIPISGEKTFDTIVENIHWLSAKGVKISLRVNVTLESVGTLKDLEKILDQRGVSKLRNVSVYCNAVHEAHTKTKTDVFPEIFSQWKLANEMEKKGVSSMASPYDKTCGTMRNLFDDRGKIFLNKTMFCMENRPYSLLFDPYGDVYGCYEEAGYKNKRIGFVTSEGLVDFVDNRYETYQSRNVASHEPCRSCSVALTCGGGCPLQAEIANGTIFSNHCDSHKELVAKSIISFVEKKTDERELQVLDSNTFTKEEMTPLL
jgi:uncharacterized protein